MYPVFPESVAVYLPYLWSLLANFFARCKNWSGKQKTCGELSFTKTKQERAASYKSLFSLQDKNESIFRPCLLPYE